MTEEEAKDWLSARFAASKIARLAQFVDMVKLESARQNLVSASSLEAIWSRHVVDSAQLLAFVDGAGLWIDIGTGAGFPGMVTAILSDRETLLIEPRRRRVEFLDHVIDMLSLRASVSVRQTRIEQVTERASVISARAVSSVATILESANQCSTKATHWLLPKGRNASAEVAEAQKSWHGTFHVEHSVTDPESMIVVASGIARR